MATNSSNSTSVSILSLPTAQLATATDYLILQTTNGTQIIPFGNFNVVRTDINGNATVTGDISGTNAYFTGNMGVFSLTASSLYSSNPTYGVDAGWTDLAPKLGVNSNNYYDSFTVVNGLIISATPTSVDYINNPIYTSLNVQLTALSAQTVGYGGTVYSALTSLSSTTSTNLYNTSAALTTQTQAGTAYAYSLYSANVQALTSYATAVFDATTTCNIINNGSPFAYGSAVATFTNFFSNALPLTISNIQNSNFIITTGATTLSQASAYNAVSPFVASFTRPAGSYNLVATISAVAPNGSWPTGFTGTVYPIPAIVRVLVTYYGT
jgi:hypothetical protein